MALTFYFAPMSTASITDAVLRELGCEVKRIRVDLQAGETRTPEFLRLNPNGEVPLIVHDGVAIWESAAITLYLGEAFGIETGLFPAAGPRRGEAMKWVVWASGALAPTAGRVAAAKDAGEGLTPPQAALQQSFSILNAALADRDYLLGDYSLVDTHVFVIFDWIELMKIDLDPHRHLIDWIARCRRERPALNVEA